MSADSVTGVVVATLSFMLTSRTNFTRGHPALSCPITH